MKYTLRKTVAYCPKCDNIPKTQKNNGDFSLVVAKECPKHQPVFVKTGLNGIQVPKKFLNLFREIHTHSS